VRTLNCSKTLTKPLLIAAGLATAIAAPAWAGELPDAVVNASAGNAAARETATDRAVDPESVARANWRLLMAHNSTPAAGCFHASYPNIVWERVACKSGQSGAHSVHARPRDDQAESTGGTDTGNNDSVIQVTSLITGAFGFFTVTGVTAEDGVSEFNNPITGAPQGTLGPNEYSIQLNTNDFETTSACDGRSGCTVWQQFVYATDYLGVGDGAEGFMQYWLINWNGTCPSGWNPSKGTSKDCWANGPLTPAPNVPITDLGNVVLSGSANAGGWDTVSFTYESEAYSNSFFDFVLDISSVWTKAEFNVVGSGGGSRANFNTGSSITVNLYVADGTNDKPKCKANGGTTGESNNLNIVSCTPYGGDLPYIRLTESN
jgi:hypothetical protein